MSYSSRGHHLYHKCIKVLPGGGQYPANMAKCNGFVPPVRLKSSINAFELQLGWQQNLVRHLYWSHLIYLSISSSTDTYSASCLYYSLLSGSTLVQSCAWLDGKAGFSAQYRQLRPISNRMPEAKQDVSSCPRLLIRETETFHSLNIKLKEMIKGA